MKMSPSKSIKELSQHTQVHGRPRSWDAGAGHRNGMLVASRVTLAAVVEVGGLGVYHVDIRRAPSDP